jgi:hypothetical protein
MSQNHQEPTVLEELEERRREVQEAEEELARIQGRAPSGSPSSARATAAGYRQVDADAGAARELRELDTRLASLRIDLSIERSKRAGAPPDWRRIGLTAVALATPPGALFALFGNASLALGGALLGGLGVGIWRILEAGDSDPKGGPPPTSGTMSPGL